MSSVLPDPTTAATEPEQRADPLPRRLGVWSAVAFCVGSMIGSGIFRVPASVADNTGTVWAMMLVWVAGGVVALFGALALAELAALFPRAGGIYVFLAEAYGRLPAFLLGWTALFLVPMILAALALVFAEYLGAFVPLSGAQTRVAAVGVLALLAAVSYRSVRWGGAIQNVSTAAKVLALAGLAAVALVFGGQGTGALAPRAQSSAGTWDQFGVALIAVLWAYNGWQDLTALGGEVRDPSRSLPRALIGSTVAVMLVYLVVNAAYLTNGASLNGP